MAVRRQITLCFIVCCCANIIYMQDLADRNNASTALPSEESSNRTELETGYLTGNITAHKDGAKLELRISSKVTWKKDKSLDRQTCAATVEQKGEKGDKGTVGIQGPKGEKGEKGDKGADGIQGATGEKGEKGDKGPDGIQGATGEKGVKGDKGADGIQGSTGEKGEKGDKGADGIQGATGEKGEKGDKGADGIQGATGEKGEKGDKGDSGPQGEEGKMGEKGENGIDGTNGEKGDPGKCIGSYGESKPDNYGSTDYPAYSCYDNSGTRDLYVNRAKSFQVLCLDNKTCIPKQPISSDFNVLIKNDKVWLSSYTLDLTKFYNLKISELSYLMTTNEGFELAFEYSNEVEILEILSWNGITMKTTSGPLSNGCKGTQRIEGTQTLLEVECKPANYLPMDLKIKTSTENVSIKLSRLCFS